jgi:hypothetical protein
MYASAVEDACSRLRELRQEEWQDLALAAVALGLALAATQVRPAFAMPLFLGGVVVGALGVRAPWRRWDLLERLAAERDAHVISEVRAYASREATMERRHWFAALIRSRLAQPELALEARVGAAAKEPEALVSELEDDELAFDPTCAVACARLVSDPAQSPLLSPALPHEELRSRVHQIRSGFTIRDSRPDPTHPSSRACRPSFLSAACLCRRRSHIGSNPQQLAGKPVTGQRRADQASQADPWRLLLTPRPPRRAARRGMCR